MEREIGVLQEQGRWIAAKVDKMDVKLDRLLDSHNMLRWRVHLAASIVAMISAGLFELGLALMKH